MRPVELVKEGPPRSQKAKVRWLDGEYEGLEEWVPKVRLVAPWDEKEALLENERRMFAALETSGEVYGTTTYRAVETVFSAVPVCSWGRKSADGPGRFDDLRFLFAYGCGRCVPGILEKDRLGHYPRVFAPPLM